MSVYEAAKATFTKWLWLPDQDVLDFVWAIATANRLDQDMLWGGIIAPSGDTKTEILKSLDDPGAAVLPTVMLSSLTDKTFISGLSKEKAENGDEPSLLPKLHKKLLIVKDFTTIQTDPRRAQILGQLRDIYDGSSSMAFGTGKIAQYWSRFGILMASTPVIEDLTWTAYNMLGERFLYCRPPLNEEIRAKKIQKAGDNTMKRKEMEEALNKASRSVLIQDLPGEVTIPEDQRETINALADFVAVARTAVGRAGRHHDITRIAEGEVGTRLSKQFQLLGRGLCAVRQQTVWTPAITEFLLRVAPGCIHTNRLKVFRALLRIEMAPRANPQPSSVPFLPTPDLGQLIRLDSGAVRYVAEELFSLGHLDRRSLGPGQGYSWRISEQARKLLRKTGLVRTLPELALREPVSEDLPPEPKSPPKESSPG